MWHIVIIGYVFTTVMFAIAQPSLARQLIYLVFWTILPLWFAFWVVMVHRRNRRMKMEEQAAHLAQHPENQVQQTSDNHQP